MSGLINPHAAPEEAAYALLIELKFAPSACRNMKAIFPACWRYTTKPLNTLKKSRALGMEVVVREEGDACGRRAGVGWIAAWVISCRGR